MKFSEAWLREWVDPPVDTGGLVAQLTGAGLEVDTVEPVGTPLEGVVVARVVEAGPHPDADRLSLCSVDPGHGEPLAVVCGAPNVRAGMCAPFIPAGARLPDGTKIRRSKIRGVESNGMLCSARELALGEEADGIMDLGDDAPVGRGLHAFMGLDDHSIDIDLTPNRGDCLGLEGVAREVAVANGIPLAGPEIAPVPAEIEDVFPIRLEAPDDCPRYAGRVIRDIDPTARTPQWMRERLRRCGLRSISPVVDVTNFVMIELGQPMHAFDLERLDRGIVVRRARDGERVTLLDGQAVAAGEDVLLIADEAQAVAVGGVMGGLDSSVTERTRHIFLESAWFNPRTITLGARALGVHTDASHRFERGVSPALQARAVEHATRLLIGIVGGRPGRVCDVSEPASMPASPPIVLRADRARRLLGIDVGAGRIEQILSSLGCELDPAGDGRWSVHPPAWRLDLRIEADLVEEIARITGYEAIPAELPDTPLDMAPDAEARVSADRVKATLVARGYQEAVTYSFVEPRLQALFDPETSPEALANPISTDLAVMRTTLAPGLLGAALHNLNRQQTRVRLFETGLVFRPQPGGRTDQHAVVGGIAAGARFSEQWALERSPCDFFDAKGDVEALLGLGGERAAYRFVPESHPGLHPGQCARIERDGVPVGFVGALHPRVAAACKVAVPAFVFEIGLEAVAAGRMPRFSGMSRFPVVRRDLAVVVGEAVSAQALRDCVGQAGIDVLQNLEFFDVYRGEGIDSGKKSLAIGLTFQDPDRTLNDEDVDAGVAAIVDALRDRLGAQLRG